MVTLDILRLCNKPLIAVSDRDLICTFACMTLDYFPMLLESNKSCCLEIHTVLGCFHWFVRDVLFSSSASGGILIKGLI